MKKYPFRTLVPSSLILLTLALVSCAKKTAATSTAEDDTSTSGAAASVVGGALSSSNSGGTIAKSSIPKNLFSFIPSATASATSSCPTALTSSGSYCTASGSTMWLSLNDCSYGTSTATWSGVEAITISPNSVSCGTFPSPGVNGTLIRQFVNAASSTTPSTATRTSSTGIDVTIDDSTANLGNFDSVSISAIANGGYGTRVNYNSSGIRSSMTIARRFHSGILFDHSVTGDLSINEAAANSTSRVISGTISVYHNILRIVGNSTFNRVTHSDTCCVPVSGSITTQFVPGVNRSATTLGSALIGKTETLTFTGCKTATLQKYNGTTVDVTLNHCF